MEIDFSTHTTTHPTRLPTSAHCTTSTSTTTNGSVHTWTSGSSSFQTTTWRQQRATARFNDGIDEAYPFVVCSPVVPTILIQCFCSNGNFVCFNFEKYQIYLTELARLDGRQERVEEIEWVNYQRHQNNLFTHQLFDDASLVWYNAAIYPKWLKLMAMSCRFLRYSRFSSDTFPLFNVVSYLTQTKSRSGRWWSILLCKNGR